MRLLLDTNRYTDFARGQRKAIQIMQSASAICMPFVVLAELRAGFACGNRVRENEAALTRALQQPSISALYADTETTHHYAAIHSQLRRNGTPIPTNDIWIAALAIQHELVLFSRDPHFQHLPQLARI